MLSLEFSQALRRRQFDRPQYLYCRDRLLQQYQRFCHSFPGMVTYAVKANPYPAILSTLIDAGIPAFDVASRAEMEQVMALSGQVQLHLHNPIKSPDLIDFAVQQPQLQSMTIDDTRELEKLAAAPRGRWQGEVSIRFCLDKTDNPIDGPYRFAETFGAYPHELPELLQGVRALGLTPSLAFHPGSQCHSAQSWAEHIAVAAQHGEGHSEGIYRLNVGGGFAAMYQQPVTTLEQYCHVIRTAIAQYFPSPPPLVCEPGRALVNDCIALMTTVIHRRPDSNTVFINDGRYGGLLEPSLLSEDFPLVCYRDTQPLTGTCEAFTVYGPTCDSVDRLPRPQYLPSDIRVGDIVLFGHAGAYTYATATAFNGLGVEASDWVVVDTLPAFDH